MRTPWFYRATPDGLCAPIWLPARLLTPHRRSGACLLPRRSGASGFLLPLSGGADSAAVCAIVGCMCQMVLAAIEAGDEDALADACRWEGAPRGFRCRGSFGGFGAVAVVPVLAALPARFG
jgi:hypothetical protein